MVAACSVEQCMDQTTVFGVLRSYGYKQVAPLQCEWSSSIASVFTQALYAQNSQHSK